MLSQCDITSASSDPTQATAVSMSVCGPTGSARSTGSQFHLNTGAGKFLSECLRIVRPRCQPEALVVRRPGREDEIPAVGRQTCGEASADPSSSAHTGDQRSLSHRVIPSAGYQISYSDRAPGRSSLGAVDAAACPGRQSSLVLCRASRSQRFTSQPVAGHWR